MTIGGNRKSGARTEDVTKKYGSETVFVGRGFSRNIQAAPELGLQPLKRRGMSGLDVYEIDSEAYGDGAADLCSITGGGASAFGAEDIGVNSDHLMTARTGTDLSPEGMLSSERA